MSASDLIELKPGPGKYYVFYKPNGVHVGEMIVMEDGYYVFWPNDLRKGYWNEAVLLGLSEVLADLNKEWDDRIRNDPSLYE